MKVLDSHDVVYLPAGRGTCAVCGGGLFAVVRRYFADTGEPVQDSIHVGCIDCDVEISDPTVTAARQWVSSSYRVRI